MIYNKYHTEGYHIDGDRLLHTEWVEVNSNRLGLDRFVTREVSQEEWDRVHNPVPKIEVEKSVPTKGSDLFATKLTLKA